MSDCCRHQLKTQLEYILSMSNAYCAQFSLFQLQCSDAYLGLFSSGHLRKILLEFSKPNCPKINFPFVPSRIRCLDHAPHILPHDDTFVCAQNILRPLLSLTLKILKCVRLLCATANSTLSVRTGSNQQFVKNWPSSERTKLANQPAQLVERRRPPNEHLLK